MRTFLKLLALAPLIVGGSLAPQETVLQQSALQYEVTVSLKLVQVYVTDRSGQPVADLNKDEFIVFDEGRPIAVTDFERHTIALPNAGPNQPRPPVEKLVTAALPGAQLLHRRFFLFFDFAYNSPRGLNKAREAALHFIDSEVRPDDELGLISYSALKGLVVHEYLTTDHHKIRSTVGAIGTKAFAGRAEDIEEEYWRQSGQGGTDGYNSTPSGLVPSLNPATESRRAESKNQAEDYLEKMTSLAKALRYIAGQKQVILFSTGLPSSLIYGHSVGKASDGLGKSKFETGDFKLQTQNEDMYKEFSAANCTLYAFDTREAAKVPSLFNFDEQALLDGKREAYRDTFTTDGVFSDSTALFRNEKLTGRDTLMRFSDITGGKYFSNINEFQKNLGEVKNLTGTYYVLGYSVSEQTDGRFHDVRVEVRRKGCRVRAQAGYYSPKPFREYSDLERRLHLFDLALNGRSPFGAPVTMAATALFFPSSGGTRVQLLSRIPSEVMAKFSAKSLEFVAVILDGRNDVVSFERSQASLKEPGDNDAVITSGADLNPGSYKCRVIARDLESGMTCLASVAVAIPESLPTGICLRPPLLLAKDLPPLYVSTEPAAERNIAAWKELYAFDQERFAPIVGGVRAGAAKIFAVIPYSVSDAAAPSLNWTAHLTRLDGTNPIPVAVSPLAQLEKSGLRVKFLEFPAASLPAGNYILHFRAEDGASGAAGEVQTPLAIIP
jgi:VWFA-related protein